MHPSPSPDKPAGVLDTAALLVTPSAARLGLLLCPVCGTLNRTLTISKVEARKESSDNTAPHLSQDAPLPNGLTQACAHCATPLHMRKPHSISRTWAYLLAAAILYIPANTLPIMKTGTLLDQQVDTIMSGVIYLWASGEWPLAAIVFLASIVVPCFKLLAMLGLTLSVQKRSPWQPRWRTRLYRFLEQIGRWSMLDIFVVVLLATLVQLQALATVSVGPGALAFAAVVVLTMLATHSFDPRLIWDALAHPTTKGKT